MMYKKLKFIRYLEERIKRSGSDVSILHPYAFRLANLAEAIGLRGTNRVDRYGFTVTKSEAEVLRDFIVCMKGCP